MAYLHTTGTITGETGALLTMLNTNLIAAGWTSAFTASGVVVYRNGASGSNRYWRIRDDGPNVTSTYKEAWIRGWKVKADALDTADASNTNPFPSAANKTNGHVIRKSATADSTARTYHMYADARTCILIIYTGDNSGQGMIHYFGDYYDLLGSAGLNAHTLCRSTENSATVTVDALGAYNTNGHYLMQSYTGSGADVLDSLYPLAPITTFGSQICAFPNGADGGRYLSQVAVIEGAIGTSAVYRGRLRGAWAPMNGDANYADLDTITGSGALAGRTFTLHKCAGAHFYAIETSDTLETN